LLLLRNHLLPIFPSTCRSFVAHPSNIQLLAPFRHWGLQAAYHQQRAILPIDIRWAHADDVAGAEPKSKQQQYDRPIPELRLASFFGPLRQFNLAHLKSLILLARLF
jgi:hypothetical protein